MLSDDGLEEWIESRRDPASDDSAEVKKLFQSPLVQQFVDWFEEEEDDDDDEEDDEDEEDEEGSGDESDD